jgi:hypothetical protein
MRKALGSLATLVLASALTAAPALAGGSSGGATKAAQAAAVKCRHAIRFETGKPLAGPVALPTEACPGVRPGAVLRIPSQHAQCTFNAMFLGSDGARYMTTAGHCVLEGTNIKEKAWPAGKGPVAADGDGKRVGEFAYAILNDPKDIALIRLDNGVTASPQLCHFGGPTHMADNSAGPAVLDHFGQGVAVSGLLPGRTQLALSLADPDRLDAIGLATPGDSGSLVQTASGGAVGVLVTTGFGVGFTGAGTPDIGNVGITRFVPQLAHATDVTGVKYTLQTAPLL